MDQVELRPAVKDEAPWSNCLVESGSLSATNCTGMF
jgi:hypothetical protein